MANIGKITNSLGAMFPGIKIEVKEMPGTKATKINWINSPQTLSIGLPPHEVSLDNILKQLPLELARIRIVSNDEIIEHFEGFNDDGMKNAGTEDAVLLSIISRESSALKKVTDLVEERGQNLKILSIGSGRGDLESHLINRGHDVFGVDISEKNIKYAKEKYVLTALADAHDLPFKRNCFDLAVFSESIGHLDINRVLEEAALVVKPSGGLLISSYAHEVPSAESIYRTKFRLYSKQEVFDALDATGWKLIKNENQLVLMFGKEIPTGTIVGMVYYVAELHPRKTHD